LMSCYYTEYDNPLIVENDLTGIGGAG